MKIRKTDLATGRLVQGSKGPTTQTSGYNALGQRVARTVVGGGQAGIQLYAYDEHGRPLGVYMPDSTEPNGFRVVEEYVHLDGWRPIAVVRPSATTGMANPDIHPILTDHLGTPRKVLDGNTGDVRWSWDAKEPFGHQAPNSTPSSGLPAFTFDLRFPGQRYDEATGLFQNGFRDYHAGLGRYVQSDPLGLEAGWNTYVYVGSKPTNSIDPLGLKLIYINKDGKIEAMVSKMRSQSKRFNRVVSRLEMSDTVFYVKDSPNAVGNAYGIAVGMDGRVDPMARSIEFNSSLNFQCDGKIIDFRSTIAHEFYHAYQEDTRTLGWDAEIRATVFEGDVSRDLGIWSRGQSGFIWTAIQYHMGTKKYEK